MNASSIADTSQVSIFDSLEHLHIITQTALSKCDKKFSKVISRVFKQWERALFRLISEKQSRDAEFFDLKEKYLQSKNTEMKLKLKLSHKKTKKSEMIKEIQDIKKHLEQGKLMWEMQVKKIEDSLQEQERNKQKIEALYQQRLSEIDAELDDIIHIHKKKLENSHILKEILPSMFSQEELQEEKAFVLGEIFERKFSNLNIKKLDQEPIIDINSDNSDPSLNHDVFEDLSGTQKQVFQRLLELRKKVYRFKHNESMCTKNSTNDSLPCNLKSISKNYTMKNPQKALSKTFVNDKKSKISLLVLWHAGVIFGTKGSEKYREELTNMLNSDKLSISQRESIVYKLIHGEIKNNTNMRNVDRNELVKQESWGEMSSIYVDDDKNNEFLKELENVLSKESVNISKELLEFMDENTQINEEKDFFNELDDMFAKPFENDDKRIFDIKSDDNVKEKNLGNESMDKREEMPDIDLSKVQENSSMSIIKEFSQNESMCSKMRLSEDSKRENPIIEYEEIVSSFKMINPEHKKGNFSTIFSPKNNMFFIPEPSRPRSNPRILRKSEENCKSREASIEDSYNSFHKVPVKPLAENIRKPVLMKNKLPVIPRPPCDTKKLQAKSFRERSLQPVRAGNNRAVQSPQTKKVNSGDKKINSPATALKFRMKRIKDVSTGSVKNTKETQHSNKTVTARKVNI
ncbi:hypothetical protein SteCoe_27755 [Stentor coeruleus]|uniref:Uncharacterized protein n=1 Tax=Stentor coeruleus TaxID=5963 RepID=A0A1R2B9T4_9CILI|nr:hypothetical protein SteCoe_27755 [Stentor coeruleus]